MSPPLVNSSGSSRVSRSAKIMPSRRKEKSANLPACAVGPQNQTPAPKQMAVRASTTGYRQ